MDGARHARESGSILLRAGIGIVAMALIAAALALGWKLSRGDASLTPAPEPANSAANVANSATAKVADNQRQEVLKRIDVMPNVTAVNKERLYAYVERAQKISRVLTINFGRGKSRLAEPAIKKIVEESRRPEFTDQARDPAVVFVVLGFADKNGNEKSNLQVSLDRAEDAVNILRKRCGVLNMTQTVPMGVSTLFNTQDAAGNRVVEVWAVVP